MASPMARAAGRLPSQQTITLSSLSGCVWICGTTMTGRPEPNSAPSISSSSETPCSRGACPTTAISKRRAMRPNRSDAPAMLASSRRVSADTPAVFAAGLEIGDRGLGGLGVFLALDLDQVGRDAAEQAARDHRLVDEGDADDMRAVGLGHRDRIVGGDVRASRPAEIDDQVLDHRIRLLARKITLAGQAGFGGSGGSVRALTSCCRSH